MRHFVRSINHTLNGIAQHHIYLHSFVYTKFGIQTHFSFHQVSFHFLRLRFPSILDICSVYYREHVCCEEWDARNRLQDDKFDFIGRFQQRCRDKISLPNSLALILSLLLFSLVWMLSIDSRNFKCNKVWYAYVECLLYFYLGHVFPLSNSLSFANKILRLACLILYSYEEKTVLDTGKNWLKFNEKKYWMKIPQFWIQTIQL